MKNVTLIILIFALVILTNCEDEAPDGKINITLEANDGFSNENMDESITTVKWGCVIISGELTGCIYAYNGVLQADGAITSDAIEAGPGSAGFSFVSPGTTFSDLEGGERMYFYYEATYDNATGNPIGDIQDLSDNMDLYANPGKDGNTGEDITWVISFGAGGAPTQDILE